MSRPQDHERRSDTATSVPNDHSTAQTAHNVTDSPSRPAATSDSSSFVPNSNIPNRRSLSNSGGHPISAPSRAEPIYEYPDYRTTVWQTALAILLDVIPRQVYLHLLLRLPAVYFSRVAAIFEESALTLSEIKQMTLETSFDDKGFHHVSQYQTSTIPTRYNKLNASWDLFVDSLLRDWNTYNIVSALILSAILTILQIDKAAQDPLIRYTLLFSQICALMSLLLGCLYSIRFDSSMRKTYKAAEWAIEAQQTRVNILWNIWVLLAMPAIWLAWSSIFYIAAIMAFVWRTDTQDSPSPAPLSPKVLLFVRILITLVLAPGITSVWLSLVTFHRYGHSMDQAWARRIVEWYSTQMDMNIQGGPFSQGYNLPPYLRPGSVDEDPSHIDHPFTGSATHLAQGAQESDGDRPPNYTTSPTASRHNAESNREGYDPAASNSSSAPMSAVRSRSNASAQDIEHGIRTRSYSGSTP